MSKVPMQVPYGAVYFRKSNPPRDDWERDYSVAAEDGMNIFRHWFLWGAIEVAPDTFDWDDYDRHMDLGAKHGFKVIIAEMSNSIPEWAFKRYRDHLFELPDGRRVHSQIGVSCATGGYARGNAGALCLDSAESRRLIGNFLTKLAERYKGHPALLGYDVWNECGYSPDICFCDHTAEKFREWLKAKYRDLAVLNKTWNRYSYSEWGDVEIPRTLGPYPECLDWLEFRRINFHDQMQWRVDLIRQVDQDCLISAHGTASSLVNMGPSGSDEWLAASKVELYGFTWAPSRKGAAFWKAWQAVDLTRAGARGKPFWHAEAQGGPLWMQPQVIGRPPEDGRVTTAENIRLWNLISFAGGARGILFPRWRPLLDGPLFGAFGPYEMDGSRTDRSEVASTIANWANDPRQRDLMKSKPIRGQVGIVVVREAQMMSYLLSQENDYDRYAEAMWGAYRGFFDNNIQADWVLIDDIDEYDFLYLPYPIMIESRHAERLIAWVKRGGVLVSEGCPAYFGDRGSIGTVQPGHSLDTLFGCSQKSVEFMPDIADDTTFAFENGTIRGGIFRQAYSTTTGTEIGRYSDGSSAAVENTYGDGRAILIGTYPSYGYQNKEEAANRQFFLRLFARTGRVPAVTATGSVYSRLSETDDAAYIWLFNYGSAITTSTVALSFSFEIEGRLWHGGEAVALDSSRLTATIEPQNAVILKLSRTGVHK